MIFKVPPNQNHSVTLWMLTYHLLTLNPFMQCKFVEPEWC